MNLGAGGDTDHALLPGAVFPCALVANALAL